MHKVKIKQITRLTHNVRSYRLERPQGYAFEAGEATEMALDLDEWRNEKRPFTFAGRAEDEDIEFVIKSYDDHDGVTKRIGELSEGDTLLMDDPWETIPYNGPGIFIAGGAGITPFLALLRWLETENKLSGHTLIFSNTTQKDIILREELEQMAAKGLKLVLTVTGEQAQGLLNERLDQAFFEKHLTDFGTNFYLCGPDAMTKDVSTALQALGAQKDKIKIAN